MVFHVCVLDRSLVYSSVLPMLGVVVLFGQAVDEAAAEEGAVVVDDADDDEDDGGDDEVRSDVIHRMIHDPWHDPL